MSTTPDLGLPLISAQQQQPEVTHNEAITVLSAALNGVIAVGTTVPPGSPVAGDTYVLGASPSGAWAGFGNHIATYTSGGWRFLPGRNDAGTIITMGARQEGLRAWSRFSDSPYVFTGSAWVEINSGLSAIDTPAITGVVSGLEVTAIAGGTVFSIAAGTARFVDDYTVPGTVSVTDVTITAKTNVTDSYLSTPVTYVAVDSGNNVVQQSSRFTQDQLRSLVLLAVIAHSSASVIIASSSLQIPAYSWSSVLGDLISALGNAIVDGCSYTGNAALTLARSDCTFFRMGAEYDTDKKTPSLKALASQTPVQHGAYARDGSGGFTSSAVITSIDPSKYDDGTGSSAGIPTASLPSNKWQAMRIWLSPNGLSAIQYGSVQYNNLTDAVAGAPNESHPTPPVTGLMSFRGWLLIRGGATVTNSATDASILNTGRLGDTKSGGAGGINGDVVGPSSSTDGHIAQFNGTTGKLLKDGVAFTPITSFMPVLSFGGASTGITYSQQVGRHWAIGGITYFELEIGLTNKGSSTGAAAVSLPVASNASGPTRSFAVQSDNLTYGSSGMAFAYLGTSASSIALYSDTSGAGSTALTDTAFANSTTIRFHGFYPT